MEENPYRIKAMPLDAALKEGDNKRVHQVQVLQRGVDTRSGNTVVKAANGDTLTVGLLPGGLLGLQIANSAGVILFDALNFTGASVKPVVNPPSTDPSVVPSGSSIQSAIDAVSDLGGGVITIKDGTYYLSSDIVVPSNVTLQGETSGGVIIDFQNADYQILVSGTLIETTGTCAVNNNSSSVVGTGTAWTNQLVGKSILLKGRWFIISAVANTTHLTIEQPFDADSISGQANVIAEIVSGTTLLNFTVQNSTHPDGAVYFKYCQLCVMDNVSVYDSTIGLNFLGANNQNAKNFFVGTCGTGVQVNNSAVWTLYNFEIYASTGVNLLCTDFYNTSVSNATLSSAGGNNVTMTTCAGWGFYDMENTTAGGKGIELISCSDIEIFAMAIRDAVSDGIKLTSNCSRVGISTNVTLINNGGYGVNIAAASDANTVVVSCFFSNNTSGTINDSGTNTITAANQPSTVPSSYGDVVGAASSTNNHVVFFNGATGKVIKDSGLTLAGTNTGDQTLSDATISTTDITTNNVTSAKHGFAPKSGADATTFLNGAATPAYAAVRDSDLSTSDITTNNVSITKHGFVPKAPNDSAKFLDGTGAWGSPSGSGDMVLASVQTVTGAKTFGTIGGAVGKFILAGSTSGSTIVNASAAAGSTTITLPAATDTLVGKATTDTLTNKSLTTPVIDQFNTASGLGAAWASYTPTLANLTLGNGTSVGAYQQIGKTVHFRWTFTLGSTSSVGTAPTFTLPVAPTGMTANVSYIFGNMYDASGQGYFLGCVYVSGSTMLLKSYNASFNQVLNDTITASVPFVWTTSDIIHIGGTYEAA